MTLVVAVYNEAARIEACLESLARQDYPADRLEVLIYDGGSTDGSPALARRIARDHPTWSVHHNARRFQASAWNRGIEAASGDIIGIVSGHAELAPTYVSAVVAALTTTGADMVGGPVRAIGEGTIGRAAAVAMSTPFGVGGARHHYLTERAEVDTVFMGACRRDTYRRFPFDESMVRNQDDELSYRLLDAGGRILCDPAIQSSYRNRSTLAGLWRQYHDYGRWKIPVLRRHPRRMRVRHLAPAALVATVGVGLALGTVLPAARSATALVATAYVAAASGAAIRYRDRARPASAMALLAVYPTMHVAYGAGMIEGVVRTLIARPVAAAPRPRP